MVSEAKKRKVMLVAVFGAISGAVLFAVLYMLADVGLTFAAVIPVASAVGAAQMYMTRDE